MDDGENPSTMERLIPALLALTEFEAECRQSTSPVTLAPRGFGCFGERGPEVRLLFEPRPDIVARQQSADRDTSQVLGSQSGNLALKASRRLVGWQLPRLLNGFPQRNGINDVRPVQDRPYDEYAGFACRRNQQQGSASIPLPFRPDASQAALGDLPPRKCNLDSSAAPGNVDLSRGTHGYGRPEARSELAL